MSIVESLKKTFTLNSVSETFENAPIVFAKSRKAVLKALSESKEHNLLIGVYSKLLGEGMFLVGVYDIETDGPMEIIVFETYEQSGTILNRTRLSLDEIKMVCPLNRRYVNPILYKLQIA